jgi:MFS family permease
MELIRNQTADDAFAAATYRKVAWRLIPLLFVCYIAAYLDRVNVGFAKLGMKAEPWFSDAVFATGSGIFFIGYFLFEVPGNIILHRVGARLWIARIMIGWGIVSGLMSLSSSAVSFYTLRLLLGIAEAGFFPGIILYLTYWFPREHRARMVALFMTSIALAGVFGSPFSGWLIQSTGGWLGLKSWQWLFIIEGLPSVLIGLTVPFLLTDRPTQAKWLTEDEKRLLQRRIDTDEQTKAAEGHRNHSTADAFKSWQVWVCCLIYFGIVIGLYGASFWLPQIVENTFTKNRWHIGLYSAIPWSCAAVSMVLVSRHSDRTGERRFHVGLSALVAAVAFVMSGLHGLPPILVMGALAVAISGVMSAVACFWALPSAILSGTAAAAGIAWINSVGNLAGYVSPEMFAWLKNHYDMSMALNGVGAFMALSGFTVLLSRAGSPVKAKAVKSASLAQEDNTAIFRKSWTIYDTLTEKNYMFHREIYLHVAELLLERHQAGPYSMLDLGCGNARFLAPCLKAAPPAYYLGVDLSLTALDEAREHLRGLNNITFLHQDMLQAIEGSGSDFDIIFSGFAIHHLDSAAKQQLFHACARRLKPGGKIIMVDIVREEGQTREQYLEEYVGFMRAGWNEVIPEQLDEACAHVTAYDFPETIRDLTHMARQAALSEMQLLNRFAQHHIVLFYA